MKVVSIHEAPQRAPNGAQMIGKSLSLHGGGVRNNVPEKATIFPGLECGDCIAGQLVEMMEAAEQVALMGVGKHITRWVVLPRARLQRRVRARITMSSAPISPR